MSKTSLRARYSYSRQLHRKEFLCVQGDLWYGDPGSHITLKRESSNILMNGRVIAEAVSRRLSTAVDRVRAQVWSCGICGGQSGTGTGFLRVLRFPLPVIIPPVAPQSSSSIIWGWYNRPIVAAVPSGLSLTPPQETKKKRKHSTDNVRIYVAI
jgi:ribosomal protein L37AE/L43A